MVVLPCSRCLILQFCLSQKQEVNNTLSEIQSAETSYNTICDQALETIETFLSNSELDAAVTLHLRLLLPKISLQKDKIMALISQAQGALDTDDNDTEYDDLDPKTIAAYEQTINDFTALTGELNQQLEVLAKVVKPGGLSGGANM
ncbi:hypothetical protein LENED_003634 [Lentinula edodes]|uniref:Uncharacterized protein n=1 Tax=Lentinula edodes TaxID=5353 RepID=A0A1Q3E429_LENED|nr:hypothetical protein LENED_003634 [Lentinula edodes]